MEFVTAKQRFMQMSSDELTRKHVLISAHQCTPGSVDLCSRYFAIQDAAQDFDAAASDFTEPLDDKHVIPFPSGIREDVCICHYADIMLV